MLIATALKVTYVEQCRCLFVCAQEGKVIATLWTGHGQASASGTGFHGRRSQSICSNERRARCSARYLPSRCRAVTRVERYWRTPRTLTTTKHGQVTTKAVDPWESPRQITRRYGRARLQIQPTQLMGLMN